jgi:cell division protein FtsN
MATVAVVSETKKESPDRLSKEPFAHFFVLVIVVLAIAVVVLVTAIYEIYHHEHKHSVPLKTPNTLLSNPKPQPNSSKSYTKQNPYQPSKAPAVTG